MDQILVLLLTIPACVAAVNETLCRDGFVQVQDWCLSFEVEPTPMLESSRKCREKGTNMVVLDSSEKQHAITRHIEAMSGFNISQERKELFAILRLQNEADGETIKFCEDYKKHGANSPVYTHIPNGKIPLGIKPMDRANYTTPPGFSIKLSSIPGAGLGAWADVFIPKYTVLGIYEGLIHEGNMDNQPYAWQVPKQGTNGSYVIDAYSPEHSNWLRYVNSPRNFEEENVIVIECVGIIFYMTFKDVEPGTELMVWYGDHYGASLKVNRKHPEEDLNGTFIFRLNVLNFDRDNNVLFDDGSMMTMSGWEEGHEIIEDTFGLLLGLDHDNNWKWIPERNYTYFTGPEGLKVPFICEQKYSFNIQNG